MHLYAECAMDGRKLNKLLGFCRTVIRFLLAKRKIVKTCTTIALKLEDEVTESK
jgi:hypothetical protein